MPMRRPLLLDLFCGAGGAAFGHYQAGFEVIGVDIKPQPHYPFEFYKCDALEVAESCERHAPRLSAIHASPPCQGYMTGGTHKPAPKLIEPLRELLEKTGLPYIIENVPQAPLRKDFLLCGSMFGLPLRRHRIFETNWGSGQVRPCDHSRPIVGVYGHPHGTRGAWKGMLPSTLETWQEAMEIDWMTARELTQAIPPAYTEYVGRQLIDRL